MYCFFVLRFALTSSHDYNSLSMRQQGYSHKKIDQKWSEQWANSGLYEVDILSSSRPYYNLMMFPYPSAEGLHVGNMMAFTGADARGRYMRMKG